METPFSVTNSKQGDVVVSVFTGSATVKTAEAFEEEVQKLIEMKPKGVVLDLAKLEFMSSFALGAFLKLLTEVKGGGGWVRIAAPSPYLRNLISATRVDQKLPMFDTVEGAVKG